MKTYPPNKILKNFCSICIIFFVSIAGYSQKSAEDKLKEALYLTQNKEYQKALEIYVEIRDKIDPNDWGGFLYNMGVCFFELGNLDRAKGCFLLAHKMKKNNPLFIQALGGVYEKAEQFKRAKHFYSIAIKIDEEQTQLSYHRLINLYVADGKVKYCKKAMLLINEAFIHFPTDSFLILKRGEVNYYLDSFDEAKKDLSAIIENSQDSITVNEARVYRGLIYSKLEDFSNASLDLNRVEPLEWEADFYAVRAYSNSHMSPPNFEIVWYNYQKYVQEENGRDTLYLKAFILNGLGQYEEALRLYNKCMKINHNIFEYSLGRAETNFHLSRMTEGCNDVNRCYKILKGEVNADLNTLKIKYGCK